MTSEPPSAPRLLPVATGTFILRLRQEWVGDALKWRGWIVHLPSGERAAVQDWQGVKAFVRRFGMKAANGKAESGEAENGGWEI